jgi:hypothetical protein
VDVVAARVLLARSLLVASLLTRGQFREANLGSATHCHHHLVTTVGQGRLPLHNVILVNVEILESLKSVPAQETSLASQACRVAFDPVEGPASMFRQVHTTSA